MPEVIMKRKQAAIHLSANAALVVTAIAAGAPAWGIWTLATLALPVLVVAVLPEARRDV
ncbi:MAG: hypothetical protein FWD83_06660 [Promicromonosporaceae bacterium]|nr:hypothetical protein [Promicromonosporaceae bacterium]